MRLSRSCHVVVFLALCGGIGAAPATAKEGFAGAYLAARAAAANADFQAADLWFRRAEAIEQFHPEVLRGQMISALALGDLPRASALADTLVDVAGADSTTALAQIAEWARAKDYAAILAAMDQGAELGPLLDDVLRGWAHVGLGRMNDGIAQFGNLIDRPSLAGFGQYHKAIALALAGDFEGAANAMQSPQAAPQRGTRRGAIFLAQVLSQIGQSAEAAQILAQIPNAAGDPRLRRMQDALAQGQALALTGFQDASSGLAEAFFSLSIALDQDSDATFAFLAARIASALRPEDSEAILLTATRLERLENYDLAAQTYAQIAPDAADFVPAEIGRADAIYAAGRAEESLQILQDLAAKRPDVFDVQVALGHGLRRAARFAEAITAYDAALALLPKITPQNWAIFYSRGIAHDSLRQFDQAEADFRQALELNPNQPNVLNYLGYSLVDRGEKLEEALGMIQRAVAARPDSGYIVDSLAWALYKLGRYDEAMAPMERAAELEPVDPIITDHLGDVLWANGRKREAVYQWRRALSFEPTEKDAERIRLKLELGLDEVRRREGAPPFPRTGEGGL